VLVHLCVGKGGGGVERREGLGSLFACLCVCMYVCFYLCVCVSACSFH